MLLAGAGGMPLRVALVTTHLALTTCPPRSPARRSTTTLASCTASCGAKFGIAAPRIAVCGLNPHAGEGGHLGREEIEVIAPAIAAPRAEGIALSGPLPADTRVRADAPRSATTRSSRCTTTRGCRC